MKIETNDANYTVEYFNDCSVRIVTSRGLIRISLPVGESLGNGNYSETITYDLSDSKHVN